ncbi:vWA domain-containing protein [Paenibacillus periandrae]|uniref:vWA domain-containing protein n=1 Tax=Paenibacillus periandrae TaxID=1761741 RepID=UPI001F08E789|nr:VWA domain-containing protein [Paenibacillus periandrae]
MSFLKGLFGGGNKNQGGSELPQKNHVNLAKDQALENLSIRKETFKIVLEKSGNTTSQARVVFVMDKSGSSRALFKNGVVQRVIERLLPVALRMDDNGELDMYLFSSDSNAYKRLNSITETDFFQYVDREILGKRENNFWGGTEYAPIMEEIVQQYGINDPSNFPTLVLFITDGANSDKNKTKSALIKAAHYPIFWQFIGLNEDADEFEFLQRLDDLRGRVVDNANFFQLNDIDKISDEDLYFRLMNEFPNWVQEVKRQEILR